jgi:outer membrane protein OmpA-like peptidoglycan-associated protein
MTRHRSPRQALSVIAAAVMLGTLPLGDDPPAGGGGGQDSRSAELVDSRQMTLAGGTVIREGETPVIDTTSAPDREVVSLRTDVLFAFGSAQLSPEADRVIDRAVEQIQALDGSRLVIVGHTDSIGSDAANQTLSEARAAAVDGALRAKLGAGAPPSEVVGQGESEPVAPNEFPDGSDNPAGRALNRRVAVEVIS